MIHYYTLTTRNGPLAMALNDNECDICHRSQQVCEIDRPWRNHTFIAATSPVATMPNRWHHQPQAPTGVLL